MTPLNGAAGKPAKTAARRTASKPVVPVLPLNYPQRHPAAAIPVPDSSTTSPSTPVRPNGQAIVDKINMGDTGKRGESPAELRREGGQSSGKKIDAVVTSVASLSLSSPLASGSAVRAASEKITETPTAPTAVLSQTLASPTPTRAPAHLNNSMNNSTNKARPSEPAAREHSGPSFPPAMVNRPTFHQPHASNGSLIFGQMQNSNASSPVPHSGNGFPPPPPPGLMQYPQGTRPLPAVDVYGRPLIVSPTIDGYPPSIVSHPGPPTPHSFHGSQSSIPADEASFASFRSLNGGQNGYPTDPTARVSSGHDLGMNMHMNNALHLTGHPAMLDMRDQEDLAAFVRHGLVANDSFSDCVLEVRFPTSPQFSDHPQYRHMQPIFRTPAHRFILSRSPILASLMKSVGTPANGLVYLDIRDEYMRPDVFGHVVHSLYGWPFAEAGVPFYSDLPPRNIRDDMKTTLSYVATARYLKLDAIYVMAVQRASRLLCWETVESVVAFVVPIAGVFEKHRDFNASELLDNVTSFIVDQFPRDFVLDVDAIDTGFTRLPSTGPHSRQSSTSQAHPQRAASNARLSHIRFGDLSPEDRNGAESASPTDRQPTLNETILSRILLNLPFELLKRILEHPHLIKRSNDDGNAAVQKLMSEIVAEREARRLASLKPSNKQLEVLHQALNKASRPLAVEQLGDFLVNNMGFKEEVLSGDGPYLGRTWTGGGSV
ncbi:hypothetical protein V8F20_004828 [Naviculisporaceae sp. PSN 640]